MAAERQFVFQAPDQSASTQPKPSDIALVPFSCVEGQWTLPDPLLITIANRAYAEGKLRRVFVEGGVSTPVQLIEMWKRPANLPVFAFRGLEPLGFGWLNGVSSNRAYAHFCMLDAASGYAAVRALKLFFNYWLSLSVSGEPVLDTLLGVIPETNERAIRFAEHCGCVRVGPIPQMLRDVYTGDRVSGVVLYYQKVNHDGLRRQRR